MDWKKVQGMNVDETFPAKDYILKIGDSVQGRYLEKVGNVGENNATVYVLEDGYKKRIGVWGSTVLNNKMARVSVGKMVKIEYLGEKPSPNRKGRNYKDWEVYEGIDTPGDETVPF